MTDKLAPPIDGNGVHVLLGDHLDSADLYSWEKELNYDETLWFLPESSWHYSRYPAEAAIIFEKAKTTRVIFGCHSWEFLRILTNVSTKEGTPLWMYRLEFDEPSSSWEWITISRENAISLFKLSLELR